MTPTTLFVCSLCGFSSGERNRDGSSGGEYLIDKLQQELKERQLDQTVELKPLRCMASCSQPCNVSVAAPNKLTYIFSNVSPTESAAIVAEFCQQHVHSSDGRVPYRERSPAIRAATAFVLPPLPTSDR
ncbi:DUF1636 domain-containing protein [Oscillatoria sp. CS-180]|uniref:DUF1636 domain-containing protein n=1 Tax=Oscillatoria sp. CS-180 TaxID=3021720 RepID=UPI0023313579|nr:DUF1636 domain-containing protein [Oscillatoria sp. CS-180]MDB9527330.1 DUF1636 domain-containing protein [Oscillatoria sp. CS-180]